MKLLVFILNEVEKTEELLKAFQKADIKGATLINSTGMANALLASGDDEVFGSLRHLLNVNRNENRTFLLLMEARLVKSAVAVIESVVGDLSRPNTGIVFTLPVDLVKGAIGLESY